MTRRIRKGEQDELIGALVPVPALLVIPLTGRHLYQVRSMSSFNSFATLAFVLVSQHASGHEAKHATKPIPHATDSSLYAHLAKAAIALLSATAAYTAGPALTI
jgi:hypothetical protein